MPRNNPKKIRSKAAKAVVVAVKKAKRKQAKAPVSDARVTAAFNRATSV